MSKVKIECYDQLIGFINEAYIWADTDPILQYTVTNNINDIIIEVQADNLLSLDERLKLLLQKLEEEIIKYLFTYNEKELVVGLLLLKAQFRSKISLSNNIQKDYEVVNRHSEILQLIKILLRNNKGTFKGKSILNGSKNLAMSFRYSYYFNVIVDNIEMYNTINKDSNLDTDLFNMLEEGFFYTDEYNNFMDSMLKISEEVIPEESEIQTLALQQYLRKKGYYIETIADEVNKYLYDNLKLKIEHINGFCFKGNNDISIT
jgi:hypothetical protein